MKIHKALLLPLLLVACSVKKFVVENETATTAYWVRDPVRKNWSFPVIDTILQVHDLKGRRRLLYGYPIYDPNWVPYRLKMGDTIAFDLKRNRVSAIWQYHFGWDVCGRWLSGWMQCLYDQPPPPSCKCH